MICATMRLNNGRTLLNQSRETVGGGGLSCCKFFIYPPHIPHLLAVRIAGAVLADIGGDVEAAAADRNKGSMHRLALIRSILESHEANAAVIIFV